jgi:hypothetical protein
MTVALPPDWPPCGAPNRDGRVGQRCRALGDGYGGRCRWHGGLEVPPGDWVLYYAERGIFIGRGEPEIRVSWRIAGYLVQRGRVRRGVFFRRLGQSLLRWLPSAGDVRPRLVSRHKFLREYVFEREEQAA